MRTSPARPLARFLLPLLTLAFSAPALAQQPQPPQQPPPAAEEAAKPDPDSLAKFVPAKGLLFYLEFQGTRAHALVWERASASAILSKTKTGSMLTSIVSQIAQGGLKNVPNSRLSGADVSQILTHALEAGFVFGLWDGGDRPRGVLVLRDAFETDIRAAVGRFLATSGMAKPGMKTTSQAGRTLALNPDDPRGAWWIEGGKDLVVSADFATVLSVLQDKTPSMAGHETRATLLRPEGRFEPILIAFADIPPGADEIPQLAQLGLGGLKRFDLRWGPEDQRLKTILHITAPAPRTGLFALIDQPTFSLDTLHPMPEGVKEFTAFSVDPAQVYDQFKTLAALAPGGQGMAPFAAAEKSVEDALGKDLRDDILAQLGPRVLFYTTGEKPTGLGGLLGKYNPLASFQLPPFVEIIEVKDPRKFVTTLNETVHYLNARLSKQEDDDDDKENRGSGGSNRSRLETARFRMLSPEPLTYMLSLPRNLSTVISAKPTILLSKKSLILAASPQLARAAMALEEKPEGRWTPNGETAEGALDALPESLLMLRLTDARDSLPSDLAALPDTLQGFLFTLAAASQPPPPAAPGAGAQPGRPGSDVPGAVSDPNNPPPLNAGSGSGYDGIGTQGGQTGLSLQPQASNPANLGSGSGGPGIPGGPGGPGGPGQPGNMPAAPPSPLANIRIQVPPDQRPDPTQIRNYLQPGSLAVSVDSSGLTIIQRESFPDIGGFVKGLGLGAAVSLPAIQSARAAARRAAAGAGPQGAQAPGGGAVPGAPPSAPGAAPAPGAPPSAPGARPVNPRGGRDGRPR